MAASKIRIYKENGVVHIVTTGVSFPGITQTGKPRVQRFPTAGELTASVVDTNKIKIEDSQGNVIVTDQLPSQFLGKTGSGQIAATLAGVRDTLNGTGYFGAAQLETRIGSVESDVSTAQTDITALKNATKTTAGDRGVFVNDSKGTTTSHMSVTTSAAKLQAGGNTKVNLSETSPGTITLDVQAGSTGNETSVTAITIAGSSVFNNSTTTFNQPVDFDHTVTGLTSAAIPNLAASKITSGTFTTTRIPSLNASKIGSGTLADARVAVSNVTQHEASLSITESQISDLSHYTDASVNTHLNQSSATSGQYLKWTGTDYAWGTVSSGGLGNVVEDTTPQLGGDLDVSGNKITSASNGDVVIDPAGTGAIVLKSNDIKFEGAGTVTMSSLKFYEASALEGNYVAFTSPLSISSDVTWTLPAADGTSGQVLKTNGSGTLSFATVVQAVNPVMQGTASIQQVGGLPAGLKIFDDDTSHGVRLLAPDLTADVDFTLPAADGSSGQVLKTDGSGNLSFVSQTSDTNTNIANTNLTLDADRITDTDGNTLTLDPNGGTVRIKDNSITTPYVNCEQGELQLNGLTFPTSDGTNGQVLQTNGSGALSFATASGGGGMTETPFVSMSGRASFSAADEEERVLIGTSYGWSFYSQTTEMGDWSSSDTINSTTHSLAAYLRAQSAMHMPSDAKKVRMKVSYRVQNGNSTDFGFSIWSGALSHNSTASSNLTLRGASVTQTVGTSSITAYTKEFTTTSTITDDAVFLTIEQRGGGDGLSTTAYVYYNIHLFLVD